MLPKPPPAPEMGVTKSDGLGSPHRVQHPQGEERCHWSVVPQREECCHSRKCPVKTLGPRRKFIGLFSPRVGFFGFVFVFSECEKNTYSW